MAKEYQVTSMLRFANGIMMWLLRRGVNMPGMALLTLRGRRSGKVYSIPVQPVEEGGKRWLVSPYGVTNWVKNVRTTGQAGLRWGGRDQTVRLREVDAATAAPILKLYLGRTAIVRPYFDVLPEASLEAFTAEAPRHPVFQIVEP